MYKLIIIAACACLFTSQIVWSGVLLTNGKPSAQLLQIFEILNLKHDGTAKGINEVAQKELLRKPGQERWQMEDTYEAKRKELLPVFVELGMYAEMRPKHKSYEYIIVYGASVPRMKMRLRFLEELWRDGVRGKGIVFLTGERPLDQTFEIEDWKATKDVPATEAEAAQKLWKEVISDPDLSSKQVNFVIVPMLGTHRPSTAETINVWVGQSPKAGKWLAISSNPFISYQDLTTQGVLLKSALYKTQVQLETVGHAAPEVTRVSSLLDNLARILYTEINQENNLMAIAR